MRHKPPFKWRHFEPTIILLFVGWYCRYQLSYRDLEEMMCVRGLSVESFHTAERTLEGIEAVDMIRKGQVERSAWSDARRQATFVASLFGVAAWRNVLDEHSHLKIMFATQPEREPQSNPFDTASYRLAGRVYQNDHAMNTACNGNLSQRAGGLMSG